MDVSLSAGPQFDPPVPPGTVLGSFSDAPLHLPDAFGLGVAFRPKKFQALTLSCDWLRVEYSTITESLDPDIFHEPLLIDYADELHVGGEYVFMQTTPVIALRLGTWLDPDHRLRAAPHHSLYNQLFFRAGEDNVHFAAGVGLAFKKLQVDFGLDLSDAIDSVSLTAIYKFGK
jgi:hypothetical protein